MGKTKKVGSTGRFSERYGVGIKKRVLKVEEKQHAPKVCPFCSFSKIKREAAGLYICRKCNNKFTGGAYEPETLVGKTIKKMVSQKNFLASSVELLKTSEGSYADLEKEVSKAVKEE